MYIPSNESFDRQLERVLVTLLAQDILASGLAIVVDDGEERHQAATNIESVMANTMETDEDVWRLRKDGAKAGWIRLVYGNSPSEVICDYTSSLEKTDFMVRHEERCDMFSNAPEAMWYFLYQTVPGALAAASLRAGSSAQAVR